MDRRGEDAALLEVTRATMGISTHAADELGRVSVVQLRALTVLRELGPASLVQLAVGVAVTASTTSRLVDRLVAGGFVERHPSPESRRQIELRLTPDGEAMLDRYDQLRLTALQKVLDRLPEDRRAAVTEALAEFAAAARPLPETAAAR